MAEIQIVYREGYCDFSQPGYSLQCHMECCDNGCRYFYGDEKEPNVIPFGDCKRASFHYKYKGWSGKRYEIEECFDPYNPHLDSMLVTLGKTTYDCVKVILDGKCIFNEFDDETEGNDNERNSCTAR